MQEGICQLCNGPIANVICIDCLSNNIMGWLPLSYLNRFKKFHNFFLMHFHYIYLNDSTASYCIKCKNLAEIPVCPYCYVNKASLWIKDNNPELARSFLRVFSSYFEIPNKNFKNKYQDSEVKEPGISYGFGSCDTCMKYSNYLIHVNGYWICPECKDI
jgi:hypothetical protein